MAKLYHTILVICSSYFLIVSEAFDWKDSKSVKQKYYFKLKGINCESTPELVNLTCKVKPARGKFGVYYINLTFFQEVREMFFESHIFTKSSSNTYYPTAIKFHTDYCMLIGNDVFLKAFDVAWPMSDGSHMTEVIPMPKCPFKGTYLFNFTIPKLYLDPSFVPSGDHRWDIAYRSKNGKLLYKVQTFVYANGVSFRKT